MGPQLRTFTNGPRSIGIAKMKNIAIGLVIGVFVGTGIVGAYTGKYSLQALSDTNTPEACAKSKGLAALVAEIDASGALVTEWEAHCLVPAK